MLTFLQVERSRSPQKRQKLQIIRWQRLSPINKNQNKLSNHQIIKDIE